MATDRYSDDHKVVVGGTSGTKEWELQADTIRNSAGTDFYIATENAYYSSNSSATFSCNGTKFSYTDEARIDFYQNLIVNSGADIIMGSGSDIKMSDTSKLYGEDLWLVAGKNTSTGLLKITSGGDADFSEPYIYLIQTSNTISINCDQIGINSPEIYLDGDVRKTGLSTITLAVSPASFVPSGDSNADTTTITLHGVAKHEHSGLSGPHSYFAMPLPDSIPNGASIISIGARLEKLGGSVAITIGIRTKDLVDGSPESDEPEDGTFGFSAPDDGEELKTRNYYLMNIDKNRNAYTIWCDIVHGSDTTLVYIHGLLITYTTDRIDNNE